MYICICPFFLCYFLLLFGLFKDKKKCNFDLFCFVSCLPVFTCFLLLSIMRGLTSAFFFLFLPPHLFFIAG
ncbi:hypothetical protein TCDM_04418 [Trypanosoma cruzi Dm28c]|uniref:Uncharacterized protein n=1 Tax=Trypanosoma cruzi Dm28c TaxID=1416333 RepID=V5BGL6_TRYCR|nr:hypothetical protein TCDM_04418 [Trypanosoma cruzi Dm28c]